MKTIKISKEAHHDLAEIKAKNDLSTFSETILMLIAIAALKKETKKIKKLAKKEGIKI